LKPFEYFLILIQGVFFSYLGNVFSLKGIEYSPNPGYSLIISKSYVVFTTVASIFLFSAPLTSKSVIAILCIIVFSGLIMIDKDKSKSQSNALWLPYTIGAFFCWGLLALSSKYLLNLGVPILTRLIYVMMVASALSLGEIVVRKVNVFNVSRAQLLTLLMIGVLGAGYAYFMQVGFNLAPNVGFVNATNAASISLLTLMSAFFFKDELTIKKMVGIVGVTVGLIALFV
jgi:drug/metabolite transporter (DMT)-like permease